MQAVEVKQVLDGLLARGATVKCLCMPQGWFLEWAKTPGTCKTNIEAAYHGTMFGVDAYEIGINVLEVRYHLNGAYKLDRIL